MLLSIHDHPALFTIDPAVFQVPVRALPLEELGITVSLAEITLEVAEVVWERRNTNRSLRLSHLNKIKRSLEKERWEINGEPLIFDPWGHLIEGQHRIKAVLETGITLWSLVVVGIDREGFKTMGQGARRNAGDILGIRGIKNSRTLAAALRWVYRYHNDLMMNPHPNITDDELADTLPDHPEIVESIPFGTRCHAVAAPGLCTALHYLCRKRDLGLANHFFWAFGTGENLSKGDPILVLRDRILKGQGKKVRQYILRDEQKAPIIIKTWNILRNNPSAHLENASRIAWHGKEGQKYPEID
jgi:hypothetical protein